MNSLCFKKNFEDQKPSLSNQYSFTFSRKHLVGKRVLNIGCWTGGYEYYLNKFPCQLIAIDISQEALDLAKKKYPKVKFIRGDVLHLPFKNSEFDVITMWLTLEHLPLGAEKKAVSEIHRCLKEKGVFFLSVPANGWQNYLLDPAIYFKGHRRYSLSRLKKISEGKFKLVDWEIKGGWFYGLSCLFFLIKKYFGFKTFYSWCQKKAKKEFIDGKNNFGEFYCRSIKI